MTATLTDPDTGSIDAVPIDAVPIDAVPIDAVPINVVPVRAEIEALPTDLLAPTGQEGPPGRQRSAGRHVQADATDAKAWDHRPDHSFTLTKVPRRPWADTVFSPVAGRPDAIVVPTSRSHDESAPGVAFALSLADELQCHIVFLCSGEAQTADFAGQTLSPQRVSFVHAISYDEVHPDWWAPADLGDTSDTSAVGELKYDVAQKRNIAVALAVTVGWTQLLFIDDDMQEDVRSDGLNAANVVHASHWMTSNGFAAVGWTCAEFPDNSMLCHARRLAGLPQSTFIGAGALLVRIDPDVPFFPNMYNEDWLFLITLALRRPDRLRAIGLAGSILQAEYDPYISSRVARQEKGDILAECLLNLLEDGERLAVGEGFWRRALRSRALHAARIRGMLVLLAVRRRQGRDQGDRRAALRALGQAEILRRTIKPEDCERWVTRWLAQQDCWSKHLQMLAETAEVVSLAQLIGEICNGKPPQHA